MAPPSKKAKVASNEEEPVELVLENPVTMAMGGTAATILPSNIKESLRKEAIDWASAHGLVVRIEVFFFF